MNELEKVNQRCIATFTRHGEKHQCKRNAMEGHTLCGFKDTTTVLTAPAASIGGTGSGFTVAVATLNAASSNTAVGYQAGYTNQTGTNNSFFGVIS